MRIMDVKTALYQVPRRPGLSSASTRIESTSLLLATITSDNGLQGVGWTYRHGTGGGMAMKTAIDSLSWSMPAHLSATPMEFGDYSNIGEDNPYVFGQLLGLPNEQLAGLVADGVLY